MAEEIQLRDYAPLATAKKFHMSDAFVRGIMGPFGSGKSVACIMELMSRARDQAPNKQGIRNTRFALIRNTYPELITTTLATFKDWFPPSICKYSHSPPISAVLDIPLGDDTHIHSEFLFLAIDKEDDVNKLKSLELTGAFLNEASELPLEVLNVATSRVSRYPALIDGELSWSGIVMDTNPPDDEHWWFDLAEVKKPSRYEFFRQPPALLLANKKDDDDDPDIYVPNTGQDPRYPPAENIENHAKGFDYYLDMVQGKEVEWIKVYVQGEYGRLITGKPVYPDFRDSYHCAKEELQPYRGVPLLIGLDFGMTPGAVICQMTPKGHLHILDELWDDNMGIQRFAQELLIPRLQTEKYRGLQVTLVGDPAGAGRAQTDEKTCMDILLQLGLPAEPAETNVLAARVEAVTSFLIRTVSGEPAFQLSPTCRMLRKGFQGGYHYRKMKVGGLSNRFTESPEKNEYSHLHDALQYAALTVQGVNISDLNYTMFSEQRGEIRRPIKKVDAKGWT